VPIPHTKGPQPILICTILYQRTTNPLQVNSLNRRCKNLSSPTAALLLVKSGMWLVQDIGNSWQKIYIKLFRSSRPFIFGASERGLSLIRLVAVFLTGHFLVSLHYFHQTPLHSPMKLKVVIYQSMLLKS